MERLRLTDLIGLSNYVHIKFSLFNNTKGVTDFLGYLKVWWCRCRLIQKAKRFQTTIDGDLFKAEWI